jgi:hypothetical protein
MHAMLLQFQQVNPGPARMSFRLCIRVDALTEHETKGGTNCGKDKGLTILSFEKSNRFKKQTQFFSSEFKRFKF